MVLSQQIPKVLFLPNSLISDRSLVITGQKRTDVDDILELMMCRWATKMRDREVDLRKTFRAGDVDLNNVLSFGACFLFWILSSFSCILSPFFFLLLTSVFLILSLLLFFCCR